MEIKITKHFIRQAIVCQVLLLAIFLMAFASCTKDTHLDEFSKKLVVDGNLHELISYDNLKSIEHLIINGIIKADDWEVLQEMALTGNLSYLDLTEATIIGNSGTVVYGDNEIPSYQFHGSNSLQVVLLPKNLRGICTEAFNGCSKLNKINFPSSLKYVGDESFANCPKLTHVELPNSIDSIGARAFYKTGLQGDFSFPMGLRVVGKQAFAQTDISSVSINHDVYASKDTKMYTLYNNSVFASCKHLKNVVVSEGCTCLEVGFTNCESLANVNLPSTLKYIGRDSRYTHNYVFTKCTSLSNINLPEGLIHIGMHTFDSTSFKVLDIPKTVQTIGDYSFKNANIPIIKVHWDKPIDVNKYTFDSFDLDNSVLSIPTNTSIKYLEHEYWGLFGKIIEI